jgi:hypothetical protein
MSVRAKSRTKFTRDRIRQNVLGGHGWRIVHFTADMDDRTIAAQVVPYLPVG